MHKFVRDLITEWRKLGLPFADETLVVAVSGGADSLSLLLALDDLRTRQKLKLRLVAAHFNHKLRGHESDADEQFVKHLTAEKGIELAIGHGPIASEGNLEQNARNARYAFLTRTAENVKAYGVVTAHTINDQAETFLLNLIRGSGIGGLSGMRPVRELRSEGMEEWGSSTVSESPLLPFSSTPPLLIRPFLTWARRADTENFCRECGVDFRYDTMNEDMSFKRVRVRKILLPVLKDLNPKIIETLARTADLMRQSGYPPSDGGVAPASGDGVVLSDAADVQHESNLSGVAENHPPAEAAGPLLRKEGSLSQPAPYSNELLIKHVKILDKSELYRTLRFWLRANRGDLRSISLKHIEAIERLALSPKSGRLVELPGGGLVRKHGGRLVFGNIMVDK